MYLQNAGFNQGFLFREKAVFIHLFGAVAAEALTRLEACPCANERRYIRITNRDLLVDGLFCAGATDDFHGHPLCLVLILGRISGQHSSRILAD